MTSQCAKCNDDSRHQYQTSAHHWRPCDSADCIEMNAMFPAQASVQLDNLPRKAVDLIGM